MWQRWRKHVVAKEKGEVMQVAQSHTRVRREENGYVYRRAG